jgi:hypothetical protein
MKPSIVLILFLGVLLGGCASPKTVQEVKAAQGHGVTRVYQAAPVQVHAAVLAAAKAKGLEVVEDDPARGRVILSHGVTALSWGEKIAVFLTPSGANGTQVEVVSKPVMETLNFPPDWPKILLDQIGVELQQAK